MNEGKKKCEALKMIRKQIADANGIEYAPTECHYEGECKGTCPKCEAELEYLTKAINAKKKPRIVGVAPIKKTVMGVVAATAIGLSMAACDGEDEGDMAEPHPEYDAAVDSLKNVYSDLRNWSDQRPSFVGGRDSLDAYGCNFVLPEELRGSMPEYSNVSLVAVIDIDGSIIDAVVYMGGNAVLNSALEEFVKNMPKWNPATHEGKVVRVVETLWFDFEGDELKRII